MGKATTVDKQAKGTAGFPAATAICINTALAEWFDQFQRPLNFRNTRDPYAIMVSEFMLQQTTVTAVEPYYERFLRRFKSVHELASASEDEVMQYWAGLGYYRRARQLRAAAVEVVARWDGNFPQSLRDLQSLPGFGRYTAGAVLSFAFNRPAPILETNTLRVFARLAGLAGVVGDTPYMKRLWEISESLVSRAESPRLSNLAAMELGALVCKPKPRCEACPVQQWCLAFRSGTAAIIPEPRPRREKKQVNVTCALLRAANGRYLVRKIPEGEWHSGLWEFPTARAGDASPDISSVHQIISSSIGRQVDSVTPFTSLKYTVTHHEVTCHVFHCHADIDTGDVAIGGEELRFFPLDKISGLAMGSAQKKLLKLLLNKAAEDSIK